MFTGYIPAVVTPFKGKDVDIEAFEKYINWLITIGVNGVVVCGSTGESISLNNEEKKVLVEKAVEISSGRIPVIAGIITAVTDDAIKQARMYEKAGADALLCVCPYYVKPTQEGLLNHFTKLHETTILPIILYNNPGRTAIDIKVDTLRKLAALKRVVALKEASNDLSRFLCWRQHVKENFSFLSGNDDTFCGALALGAHGVISVTCNVVPEICVDLYKAWMDKNFIRFNNLRDKLMNIHGLMFAEPSPAPSKYALSLRGVIGEEVREPLLPLSQELKNKIKFELEKLGVL